MISVPLLLALTLGATASDSDRLDALRSELAAARQLVEQRAVERGALEVRHQALNQKIGQLKGDHLARGALISAPELDASLRESQELSEQISQKIEAERRAELDAERRREQLTTALDREIGRLHASWDSTPPAELRQTLVPRLRTLHAERRKLRRTPALQSPLPKLQAEDSDDPEVLLEMADALLDSADKLRREEKAVAEHIERLLHEQELERRMNALFDEAALFDEGERRISLSRSVHLGTADAAGSSSGGEGAPDASDVDTPPSTPSTAPPESSSGSGELVDTSQSSAALTQEIPASRSNLDTLSTNANRQPALWPDWEESESIEDLRRHQSWLRERAEEMKRKADAATKRARDLF